MRGLVPGGRGRRAAAAALLGGALGLCSPAAGPRGVAAEAAGRLASGRPAVIGLFGLARAQSVPAAEAPIAAGELAFSQAGVPAEAAAGNAVLARDEAFAGARRLAWDRMLAAAGLPPRPASPAQLERLVSSIVIEQERVTPTRYSGRVTVNFSPGGVRSAVNRGGGGGGGGGAPADSSGASPAAPRPGPAVLTIEVQAAFRSLAEWLDLRRRLQGAAPVASVELRRLSVDAAILRLGLRQGPAEAAAELAGLGVALTQAAPGGLPGVLPVGQPAGAAETWWVRLAGGG